MRPFAAPVARDSVPLGDLAEESEGEIRERRPQDAGLELTIGSVPLTGGSPGAWLTQSSARYRSAAWSSPLPKTAS